MRAETVARRARVLLVINLILAGWALTMLQRTEPGVQPVSSDFVSFYAAGKLALLIVSAFRAAMYPRESFERGINTRLTGVGTVFNQKGLALCIRGIGFVDGPLNEPSDGGGKRNCFSHFQRPSVLV